MDLPHKTLAIRDARDFLYKLRWESERLDKLHNDGNDEFVYVFINAALTAWHMVDWAYHDFGPEGWERFPTPKDFREYVRDTCGYMVICREIADGSKHAKLTRNPDRSIGTVQISEEIGLSVGLPGWRPWYVETRGVMHDPRQVIRSCLYYWIDTIVHDMPQWGACYPSE
ncbi:hypothetical protein [Achromobacter insolitus]|uniref:hypothetical protein n=1 Tax=Achromobacter insolitus TaxID=217204 RepID=UPI00367062E4